MNPNIDVTWRPHLPLLAELKREAVGQPWDHLVSAYEVAQERAERAEALLRKLEWSGLEWDRSGGTRCCPVCERAGGYPLSSGEHAAGCELAAIIGAKVAP